MPWIEKCLQSVPEAYPVIVLDNASTDGTVAFVKEQFPEVTVLPQTENLGFGKANNVGIRYALSQNCEAVFLLNQDAYLFPDTLSILETFAAANPEYGILSPLHYAGDGYHLDKNFTAHLLQSSSGDFTSDALQNKVRDVYNVPFVNAAGWYIPKNTLERIGGFDPIFYHYGEDDNYCQRVRYHNLNIGVCARAKMIHDRLQTPKEIPSDYSPAHYSYMERVYKVRLADLNNDLTAAKLDGLFKRKRKDLWKAYLRLNTVWIERRQKELRMLHRILPEIQASRKKNSAVGAHYIQDNS